MKKFKYVGEHSSMTAFGIVFRVNGENQDAETSDKFIIAKLRGNSHFEEIGGKVGKGKGFDYRGDDVKAPTSGDMTVYLAMHEIRKIKTLEDLKAFAADDTRKTVMTAADEKADELTK